MNVSKSIRNRYKQILLNKKLNNNNISFNTSIKEPRNSKSFSHISKNDQKNESQAVENNLISKEKTKKFQGIDEGVKEKTKAIISAPNRLNNPSVIQSTDHLLMRRFRKRDKENFKNNYLKLKMKKTITLNELNELMDDDDTNVEYINFYLDIIKEKYKKILDEKLILFFCVLPKEICLKFNVKKNISEKERCYRLLTDISKAKDSKVLDSIISKELEFPKEFESLNLININKNINRWKIYGNKILNFKKIDNEEYFYYTLSNYIINNFIDSSISKIAYHNSIKTFFRFLNLLDNKKKMIEKEKYIKLFEYIILFLLNSQKNSTISQISNINLYEVFVGAIHGEINSDEILDIQQLKKYFQKKSISMEVRNRDIILNNEDTIKDFQNYYITKQSIDDYLLQPSFIQNFIRFDCLINPKYYFDGLLYKIIDKYVNSNLSRTSIYKCFNLKENQCPEIEEEIFSSNIHKYIRFIPYNSYNDTGRTLKQLALIIIDPSKQKMIIKKIEKIMNDVELSEYFEKFVNIVVRKFTFQHEHHHLCNDLLYFFYTDKNESINSPPKQIKNDKVIELSLKEYNDKDNSMIKESGYVFETIAYGKIKKIFYFKQLLFIGNEENDKLNVDDYRKKFEEISKTKNNSEDLLQQYTKNNILYELVSKIYFLLKEKFGQNINAALEGLVVSQKDNKDIDEKDNKIKSINDLGEYLIIEDDDHYDCHIKGTYYCNGKMFNDEN